jgi:hypothetical protein
MAGFGKLIIAAAAAAVLGGASFASAQPVPPPLAPPAADDTPVDPAKLAMAHRLLDMQMSQMNLPAVIKSMDRQMFDQVMKQSPNADPAMQRRVEAAVEKAQDEMMPKIMDGMAAAFARNLSQKELDDSVAFYSSPSGQAILHKMPAIMGDVIASLGEWMPRMRQAVIDGICADNGCTPAQREAMEHPQPPGARPPR